MPSLSNASPGVAYVAGTFDTKERELSSSPTFCDKPEFAPSPSTSARREPRPTRTFRRPPSRPVTPRGPTPSSPATAAAAIAAMAEAFRLFVKSRTDVVGLISARRIGRHGAGHARACARLPIGMPKLMVSTVASGNVAPLRRPERHRHDVFGDRRRRPQPHLARWCSPTPPMRIAGMVAHRRAARRRGKPAIGLTMFGVTTPCVQAASPSCSRTTTTAWSSTPPAPAAQSMEKLADRGCSPA